VKKKAVKKAAAGSEQKRMPRSKKDEIAYVILIAFFLSRTEELLGLFTPLDCEGAGDKMGVSWSRVKVLIAHVWVDLFESKDVGNTRKPFLACVRGRRANYKALSFKLLRHLAFYRDPHNWLSKMMASKKETDYVRNYGNSESGEWCTHEEVCAVIKEILKEEN